MSKKNLSRKDLFKRINYQLTSNFFSLEELQEISFRHVKKVIKLIAKLEKVKLSRQEVKELAIYLTSNLESTPKAGVKLWSFIQNFLEVPKKMKNRILIIFQRFFPKNYRQDRFELMLN